MGKSQNSAVYRFCHHTSHHITSLACDTAGESVAALRALRAHDDTSRVSSLRELPAHDDADASAAVQARPGAVLQGLTPVHFPAQPDELFCHRNPPHR